jgi:hypothetical protein
MRIRQSCREKTASKLAGYTGTIEISAARTACIIA